MKNTGLVKFLSSCFVVFLCFMSAHVYAYEHHAVAIDGSLEDAREAFGRLGQDGWGYAGNDSGYLIFTRHQSSYGTVWSVEYVLDTPRDNETVQQFLNRHGEKGNFFLGFNRNYAIFLKPAEDFYRYRYLAVAATPEQVPDGIPAKFLELGQQGWRYKGELGSHLIFQFDGAPFIQYATTIKAEWQADLPGLLDQLGEEGWAYVGKGASHYVFEPGNRVYDAVERPDNITDFSAFLNATSWMQFVGSSDSYLLFAEGFGFPHMR